MRQRGLLLVLVACAHNVPQDRATGTDGRLKGAKPIALVDGEAKERGIVTYPGGDRIDWKAIEIPKGQFGKLDLQLSWRAPRAGLQLAFDVFDQWQTPVVAAKGDRRKRSRVRSVSIDDARGTYYVRVYAPQRGDAGQYTLVASFTPTKPDDIVEIAKLPIPEPPKLPAVPETEPACDPFDVKIKACEKVCPEFGAPKNWPGCRDEEAKAAADDAAKQAAAARQACLANAPKPIVAQIKHIEVAGVVARVKLGIGTSSQKALDTTWSGEVLIGQSQKPLVGGTVRVVGVEKQVTRAEINLPTDQLAANPWVRLTPPPLACP
jgi:hypothetical protein